MNSLDEKRIELSKTKIVLLIFLAIGFVALGAWLFSLEPAEIVTHMHRSPLYVHGIGLACILFFGFAGIAGFRKLFAKGPGLVLNSSGIVYNPKDTAEGFIPWTDISGAEVFEVRRTKMLVVKLKDPQKYIERGSSLKQTLSKASYNMCGSPISINSGTLKMSFAELLSTFNQYHQKYGQP